MRIGWIIGVATLLMAGWATSATSCACGCGVFDLGTESMFPTREGGMWSLEYDFMDQNRNWSGDGSAPAANNPDLEIRTSFMALGYAEQVNRAWRFSGEVPYWQRRFRTTADDGSALAFDHGALGDVRLRAQFTGFSPDLSSGVSAGFKFPTGDFRYTHLDRDTEIGSGSTDLLFDAYHVGPLTPSRHWGWFAETSLDQPFAYHGDYRPGREFDAVAAVFLSSVSSRAVEVAPVLKVISSVRAHDEGAAAAPEDSGYRRGFIAPGLDMRLGSLRVAADLYVPVSQHVNGNQLLAPLLLKLHISRGF